MVKDGGIVWSVRVFWRQDGAIALPIWNIILDVSAFGKSVKLSSLRFCIIDDDHIAFALGYYN